MSLVCKHHKIWRDDAVFYRYIYKTDTKPVLSQIDESGKKGRKWTWNY